MSHLLYLHVSNYLSLYIYNEALITFSTNISLSIVCILTLTTSLTTNKGVLVNETYFMIKKPLQLRIVYNPNETLANRRQT